MEPVRTDEPGIDMDMAEAPDGEALGRVIREARKDKRLTLDEAAKAAGIGLSTLSKIENNQTRPSFDVIRKIMTALDLESPQLFVHSTNREMSGRRDYTRTGEGDTQSNPDYDHELLCGELSSKRMLPYISTIKARDAAEFETWMRHRGEKFLFVISGEVKLFTEHYRPLVMGSGDSAYFDSNMGHGCISTSAEDAKVLWVSLEV